MFSNNFMFLLLSLLLKIAMSLVHVWERMHGGMLLNSPISVNSVPLELRRTIYTVIWQRSSW